MKITITESIYVKLTVNKIHLVSGGSSKESTHNINTSKKSNFPDLFFDLFDSSSNYSNDSHSQMVAPLSNKTLFVLAPYVSNSKIQPTRLDDFTLDNKTVIDLAIKLLSLNNLFILPESFRFQNTSSFFNPASISLNYSVNSIEDQIDDGITCFINPNQLFMFGNVIQKLDEKYAVEWNLNSNYDKLNSILLSIVSKNWSIHKSQYENRDAKKINIKLKFSQYIRPFHILIPKTVKKLLKVYQSDIISLFESPLTPGKISEEPSNNIIFPSWTPPLFIDRSFFKLTQVI
jgi:hypothetical protein